ncbi:type I restriction enzyme HsdR N-terminal domain-containing protein [Desulfosarcina sp. OttesenSCG-928-G10]|nr:type I restriction enzyme HsdR N-terminal domain-containing protein [Desulfosarcina sp. OttesenSCG-928-G10]
MKKKGYQPDDIQVDMPISVDIDGAPYKSTVDLVIRIEDRPMMAIKCAAGSLGSREREIVSAARLLAIAPLPLAAVSDGVTAILIDVATRKKIGEGLDALPHRQNMVDRFKIAPLPPLSPDQLAREKLVFRSYDSMNVNVAKKMEK